jgi:hypothetical protein
MSGCGGPKGPQMAEATGTVTYKGQPLANANVVFTPDSGPAAYGNTDAEGHFVLMTQGKSGAMVSGGKVSITAYEQLAEPKEEDKLTAEDLKKMSQSRIPAKYGRTETSGLTAEVKPRTENKLTFDLTD